MNESKEKLNTFKQLIGIFFYPTKIFSDINSEPRWFNFFLILAVILLVLNILIWYTPKSENALKEKIYEKMKEIREKGRELPEDFIEKQIKYTKILAPISSALSPLILSAIIAGIIYFISFLFLDGKSGFKLNYIIVMYSMAILVLYSLINSILMLIWGKVDFTASLLLFFPSLDESSAAYYYLKHFDLFYLWQAILIGIGIKIINKWETQRGTILTLSLFILMVVILGFLKL